MGTLYYLTNETEAFDLVFQPPAIKLDQKLRDPVKDALWEERYGVKTSASDNLLTDPAISTLETATGNTVILESSKEQSFSEMNLETGLSSKVCKFSKRADSRKQILIF